MKWKKKRFHIVDVCFAGLVGFIATTAVVAFASAPEFSFDNERISRQAREKEALEGLHGLHAEKTCADVSKDNKDPSKAHCDDFQIFVKSSPAYDLAAVTRWRDTYFVNYCSQDTIWRWKNMFNISEGKERTPHLMWCDPYLKFMKDSPTFDADARDQWLKKNHIHACYGKNEFYSKAMGCWNWDKAIRKSWRIDPKTYEAEVIEYRKQRGMPAQISMK